MGGFRKHGSKHENKSKVKKRGNKGAKKDKIHGIKAGSKGIAAQYLTRAQALRKLQLSLADFRRLCILKGIYPRDPKKKPHGNDKTYYHCKDIRFLSHEPLLAKFFELETYLKKYKKAVGRQNMAEVQRLEQKGMKPEYTLHHLVRERYPTFGDALRDLDDCLSMVSLFDSLPTDQKREIRGDVIRESTELIHQFFLFIIRLSVDGKLENGTSSSSSASDSTSTISQQSQPGLQKCFASIKGYYFQARVNGETITWLVPHKYTQELPEEVDFKVLGTFNEFYRTMLKFINYKLYTGFNGGVNKGGGLTYPPKFQKKKDASDIARFYTSNISQSQNSTVASKTAIVTSGSSKTDIDSLDKTTDLDRDAIQDFAAVSEEVQQLQEREQAAKNLKSSTSKKTGVFSGLKVFIQREVPFHSIYFVLKCGGANVGWSKPLPNSPFSLESHKDITHIICDRPLSDPQMQSFLKQVKKTHPTAELVQPQWVLDSFNEKRKLPIEDYGIGRECPPHLSPFVNDEEEGYVPKQREVLDEIKRRAEEGVDKNEDNSVMKDSDGNNDPNTVISDTLIDAEELAEQNFLKEIEAESKGIWASEFNKKKESDEDMKDLDNDNDSTADNENEDDIDEKAEDNDSETGKSDDNQDSEEENEEDEESEDEQEVRRKKTKSQVESEEHLENRKAMMPKKHKRLYQRIEKGEKKKEDNAKNLAKKAMKIEEKKVTKKGIKSESKKSAKGSTKKSLK